MGIERVQITIFGEIFQEGSHRLVGPVPDWARAKAFHFRTFREERL